MSSSPSKSPVEEIISLKAVLDSAIAAGNSLDGPAVERVLSALSSLSSFTSSLTADLLASTQIGLSANKLTKLENPSIKAQAKALVLSWKAVVLKTPATPVAASSAPSPVSPAPSKPVDSSSAKRKIPESSSTTTPTAGDSAKKIKIPENSPNDSTAQPAPSPTAPPAVVHYKPVKEILNSSSDQVRNKIQTLLFEALGGSGGSHEATIAVSLESAIFSQYGDTGAQYRQKYRELAMNLKDKENPEINEYLIYGYWTPEEMVKMPITELASASMKAERKKERDFHAQEIRSDLDKLRGMTDIFRCGKCGERKCTYYQKQTRSADEPMTTFVACTVCGNRWKC